MSVSTRTLTSQGIGFLETLKKPTNLLKNNLNNTRNDIKFQIQKKKKKKKKNGGIVELLIPTLNKIIRNQDTYLFCCKYEQSSQNNQCTWCSPLKYGRFFSKKNLMRAQKLFSANYGEVVLNWRTNDQIMPRFGRSFINDKCIFQ